MMKGRGSIEGGRALTPADDVGQSYVPNESNPSDLDCHVSLPPIVQKFLARPGALFHGAFRPVGSQEESERMQTARHNDVPKDHLSHTFSTGRANLPERVDYVCSIPHPMGQGLSGYAPHVPLDEPNPTERSAG